MGKGERIMSNTEQLYQLLRLSGTVTDNGKSIVSQNDTDGVQLVYADIPTAVPLCP
jgi:hypothetical protein